MPNPSLLTLVLTPLYYLLFLFLTIPFVLVSAVLVPCAILRIYDKTRKRSEKDPDSSAEPWIITCLFVWTMTTVLNGLIYLVDYEVAWAGGEKGLVWWGAVLGISSLQYLVVMVGLGGLVMVVGGMIMLGEKVGVLKGFSDEEGKAKKSDEKVEEKRKEKGEEKEKGKEKDYLLVSRPEGSRRSIF